MSKQPLEIARVGHGCAQDYAHLFIIDYIVVAVCRHAFAYSAMSAAQVPRIDPGHARRRGATAEGHGGHGHMHGRGHRQRDRRAEGGNRIYIHIYIYVSVFVHIYEYMYTDAYKHICT